MGFPAACIAYMICQKNGVDTKAFGINRIPENWQQMEPKQVRAELSKVRSAMSEIHSRVSEQLYRKTQERSREQAR